jgi:hypothetical protein
MCVLTILSVALSQWLGASRVFLRWRRTQGRGVLVLLRRHAHGESLRAQDMSSSARLDSLSFVAVQIL